VKLWILWQLNYITCQVAYQAELIAERFPGLIEKWIVDWFWEVHGKTDDLIIREWAKDDPELREAITP